MKHLLPAFIFIGAFIMLLVACNPRERVPREFPDQEEMARILADLYVTENIMNNSTESMYNLSSGDKIPGYYKNVLDKHNLTTQQFDTIRKWYAAHPYQFQGVYDQTIVILSQKEAELKREIAAEKEEKISEIKDLWQGPRQFTTTSSDSIDTRVPFFLVLDSVKNGSLKLTAFYKLLKEDLTRSARLLLITHYADSTMDSTEHQLPLSFQRKPASLVQSIDTSRIGIAVSGFLFDHDTTKAASVEVSDILLQHLSAKHQLITPKENDPR